MIMAVTVTKIILVISYLRSDGAHLNYDMTILSLIPPCRYRLFLFSTAGAIIGSIGSRRSRRLGPLPVMILGLSSVGGYPRTNKVHGKLWDSVTSSLRRARA
jgi:hypothetical protein